MLKPRVTRLRQLNPQQARRLETLKRLSQLLDSAFVVPGTSYRIGLDPIIGLFPLIGDLISPLFTIAILWQCRDLGVPRVVQVRMLSNAAIDAVLGAVPIIGDIFDFAWKANDKNMVLLERHAQEHRGTAGDWLFVLGIILVMVALTTIPFLILGWLSAGLWRRLA